VTGTPWTVVVHHNGHPITGHVPLDAWATASILARLMVGIAGGPVSVMAAAHNATPNQAPDPVPAVVELTGQGGLFDHPADEPETIAVGEAL
jgi:hypothetical protein